jgi:RNA polymerase sigma-70 factor (ECF subfamily)
MEQTSVSLLERLRQPGDQEAWERFVKLYTPLLYHAACRLGQRKQDSADLVQEVFLVLLRRMPRFEYDRKKGSFRSYLWTILANEWRNRQGRRSTSALQNDEARLSELAGPDGALELEESEYRERLVRRALQLMEADFQPATWRACWETVVAGRSGAEVAAELGISVASVHGAKSRVLKRLREELQGMLE